MKNLRPWRLLLGLFFMGLIGLSFLIDLKVSRPVKEVSINSLEVESADDGPVVSFDLVNKGEQVQEISQFEVGLNNLTGMTLDRVEVDEEIVLEPGSKRRIEMAWGDRVGSKGWLWTNIRLEDNQAHQQLSWFWPKIDLSSPTALLAFSPVVFWFVIRKSFFT